MSAFISWSGGKDSALCLHRILQANSIRIDRLVTNVNKDHDRISMHGVRRTLLVEQAAAIGIPLDSIELSGRPDMSEYELATGKKMAALKQTGCDQAIFGDIFLEDLKTYREHSLGKLSIECLFPLWNIPTSQLVQEFLTAGFRAVAVCIDSRRLDKDFCGRELDASFFRDLPEEVDPCGENGEYHSFVYDGPIFKSPVSFTRGNIVYEELPGPGNSMPIGFYFCDLLHP